MDYKKYIKEKKSHPFYGGGSEKKTSSDSDGETRKYLGVKFECCGVYTRVYQNSEGTAYIARCPKCMYTVTIGIDAREGSSSRFFVVK